MHGYQRLGLRPVLLGTPFDPPQAMSPWRGWLRPWPNIAICFGSGVISSREPATSPLRLAAPAPVTITATIIPSTDVYGATAWCQALNWLPEVQQLRLSNLESQNTGHPVKSEFQIKSEFKLVPCVASGSLNDSGGARKFGAGAIWRRASWELSVTPLLFLPAPYHTSLPWPSACPIGKSWLYQELLKIDGAQTGSWRNPDNWLL